MNYLVRGLHHIGIATDDLEKATDFYIQNLDFRLINKLDLPTGVSCWFVENHGLVLEFVSRGKSPYPTGPILHVALEVCGIDGLVDELKRKGVLAPDARINVNPTAFPSGIKNIFFNGPCGEQIELFELAR